MLVMSMMLYVASMLFDLSDAVQFALAYGVGIIVERCCLIAVVFVLLLLLLHLC